MAVSGENIQSDWNQTNSNEADYIKNKPSIPAAQVQSNWAQANPSAVDFIKNKPTIPAISTADWEKAKKKSTFLLFGDQILNTGSWTEEEFFEIIGRDDFIALCSGEYAGIADGEYPLKYAFLWGRNEDISECVLQHDATHKIKITWTEGTGVTAVQI